MTFLDSPHLFYIVAAYGLTIFCFGAFLMKTLFKWKKSKSQGDPSHGKTPHV